MRACSRFRLCLCVSVCVCACALAVDRRAFEQTSTPSGHRSRNGASPAVEGFTGNDRFEHVSPAVEGFTGFTRVTGGVEGFTGNTRGHDDHHNSKEADHDAGAAGAGGAGAGAGGGGTGDHRRGATRQRRAPPPMQLHPSINDAATPPPNRGSMAGFGRLRAGGVASMPSRARAAPRKKNVQLGVSVLDKSSRDARRSQAGAESKERGHQRGKEPILQLPQSTYDARPTLPGHDRDSDGEAGESGDVLEPLGASTDASAAAKPGLMVENGWGDTVTSQNPHVRESWDMSENGTLKVCSGWRRRWWS